MMEMAGRFNSKGSTKLPWTLPKGIAPMQRCAMAHQLAHEELGTRCGQESAEEIQADRLAAMRLIPIDELADAAASGGDVRKLATVLGVTTETLMTRERNLHPSERSYVTRQVRRSSAAS